MVVDVLRELKVEENRVSMNPAGAAVMTDKRHKFLIEKEADVGSGFTDRS
jgi:alanine dehydrogenase